MKKTFLSFYRFNLLIILGLGAVAVEAILKSQGLPQIQFLVILCLIFFYLTWAFVYHFFDKSLSLEVILEYILTALLAIVVLYGILL